jgi:sugar phosphate isomerase/epimerase
MRAACSACVGDRDIGGNAVQNHNLLSLAYLSVDGAAPIEHLEAASVAGFDAAGLRILAPRHVPLRHAVIGNAPLIRDINLARQRTGVAVFDIEVVTLTPDLVIAEIAPALETAAQLGATYIQAVSEDPDEQRAVDGFAALCDAASSFGLRVALEFMRFRRVQTVEAACALVSAAGRTNGYVLVDALHLSRSGGNPATVASMPSERLAYMQLCDAPEAPPPVEALVHEARNDRLHPGDGDLWLDALLDALPDGIPISVEVPRSADAGRSVSERAKLAGDAARRYLARYRARSGS